MENGFYFIKVTKFDVWEIGYWDGFRIRARYDYFFQKEGLYKLDKTRIKNPDEKREES